MHEAQAPYKLALNRNEVWEVRWSERSGKRWIVRTWSTGARERAQADAAAEQFWNTKLSIVARTGVPQMAAWRAWRTWWRRQIHCRLGWCGGGVVSGIHQYQIWIGWRCDRCGVVKHYAPMAEDL